MTDASAIPPVRVKILDPVAQVPTRAHSGDAGVDLITTESVRIEPGERVFVGTGIAIALPEGTVGLVHPRSGLAARHGLTIVNAPGTVDAGYRGEIKVSLLNTDKREAIELQRGDRIAQLVIQKVELPDFITVDDLGDTERGARGFGSSGGHSSLTSPTE